MLRWHAWLNTPAHRRQRAFFQEVTACLAGLQHETEATVAVVLRGSSGNYLDVAFLFGSVVSWLGLLVILLVPHPVHSYLVPLDVMALFGVGSWLCARTRLRAWLTSRRRQRRQVKTAAHAAFFEEGTHHAKNDCGALIYWSRLERRIEVLAGAAIFRAIPLQEWNAAVFALRSVTQQPRAGAAFLTQLRQFGQLLARHLPPAETATRAHLRMWRSER